MPPPDQTRDHVIRASLPWHDEELTECGRRTDDVARTITIEEFMARLRKYGQQRAAFTVCMTCWHTCGHQAQWDTDPVGVMQRWTQRDKGDRMKTELRAIAALIDAHRDEFDQFITDSAHVTDLSQRRKGTR
jgi:hypothetical protein